MEGLINKQHLYTPDESAANTSFKEKTDYLREENKNKTNIIKILSRQVNTDTINTEIKEQTTDTNQIQKKQLQYTKFATTTIGSYRKMRYQSTAKSMAKKRVLETTGLLMGKRIRLFLS